LSSPAEPREHAEVLFGTTGAKRALALQEFDTAGAWQLSVFTFISKFTVAKYTQARMESWDVFALMINKMTLSTCSPKPAFAF